MNTSLLSVLTVSLFALIHIDPAAAQSRRTWVSAFGNDANPCNRPQPCQTFAGALSQTLAGGEINCVDSAHYVGLLINKSISIRCVGVTAGVQVVGGFGIAVDAPAGSEVLLEGLDIDGQGTGIVGVDIVSATKVTIQNSSIRNFAGNGVNLAGPLGARVLIADSTILSNNIG